MIKNILLLTLLLSLKIIPTTAQSATFSFENKSQEISISPDTVILNFCKKQASYKKLSTPQQQFYYYTNYSRKNPSKFWDSVVAPVLVKFPEFKCTYSESLKTDLYASPSLPLLLLNDTLTKMVELHALDMIKSGKTGHNSSDGRTFADRFKASGIATKCGGENISWGTLTPIFALISLYIDRDLPQLGHRKALLNQNYAQIGVAAIESNNMISYYVQDFACWP